MEIIVRAAVIYLFLWMITRLVGRGTVGELSTFQLILFITMGDMVQQAVTQQDYSVTAGILAISVFTVFTVGLSWANSRWPRIRRFTHGVPVVIMQSGEPLWAVLKRERMSVDDLKAAARQQGFKSLSRTSGWLCWRPTDRSRSSPKSTATVTKKRRRSRRSADVPTVKTANSSAD